MNVDNKQPAHTSRPTRHVVDQGTRQENRWEVWNHDGDAAIATFVNQEDAHLFAAAPDMAEALVNMDLSCQSDVLNPCWNGRPTDVAGKHWGGGTACANCRGRAAIAKAGL